MESIRSSDCFYINAQYLNHSDHSQPAEVLVLDDRALLQRSEGYAIHLTRWSLDTQTNLYFVKADTAKQVHVQLLRKHNQVWEVDRQHTFHISENLPTVTAFLQWWNALRRAGDSVYPVMSIDGSGRFHLEPDFSKPVRALGNAPGGVYDHACRVQMTDELSDYIGFEKLTSTVTYNVSNYRHICDVLDYCRQIVEDDLYTVFLNPSFQTTLQNIARLCTRYIDHVRPAGVGTIPAGQHTNIMSTQAAVGTHRLVDNSWGKVYYDVEHNFFPISAAQYIYVTDHFGGQPVAGQAYINEYVTGGAPNSAEHAISYNTVWQHATAPNAPVVYATADGGGDTAQFIDQEYLYGKERHATYVAHFETGEPQFLILPADAEVQVGDLVEIPTDGVGNAHLALFNDGTTALFGTSGNFVDAGGYYSFPVVRVVTTANGLVQCELRLPVHTHLGTMIVNQLAAAAAANVPANVSPTVFINSKRPPFIPMVHRHYHSTVQVYAANNLVTVQIPYAPVSMNDSLYVNLRTGGIVGPFDIDNVIHYPDVQAPLEPYIIIHVAGTGWPATYNHLTDSVYVVSQHRVSWYVEDLARLKKMFPVWMTHYDQSTDWHHSHTDDILCHGLSQTLHGLLDHNPLFHLASMPHPQLEQRRTVYSTETFPTLVTSTGANGLLSLSHLIVEQPAAASYDVVQTFSDTRLDFRAPTYVHKVLLLRAPQFENLLSIHPNEHLALAPFGSLVAPNWSFANNVVVCGTEGDDFLVVTHHNGFPQAAQAHNTVSRTERVVVYSGTEKLGTELRHGNTNQTVKLPGYTTGRTVNMMSTDYIRSAKQGQVDLCQAFHSIVISSRDIGVLPERSNQMRSLAPIISSFLIGPTVDSISSDKYGKAKAYGETPYGTMQFVEHIRRFHKLQRIPGDLRSFSVQAELVPRDNRTRASQVLLAPGESFSCQLMFVKEF